MTHPANTTSSKGFKDDLAARRAWGSAYDAIPKSVFALLTFHLGLAAAGDGEVWDRIRHELEVLRDGGHLAVAQANRAIKAMDAA